jgi:DNA mismatch endonuclease, patch repair protein
VDQSGGGYPQPTSSAATAVMKGNRKRDTRPETIVRSALQRAGLRFRKDYPIRVDRGRPIRVDIAFPNSRIALFVDGCFWHRCPEHGTTPRANAMYWNAKLARNVERDHETDERLLGAGWQPVRIWEHDPADEVVARIGAIRDARASATTPTPSVGSVAGKRAHRSICERGGMLSSGEAWSILNDHAPRGEWLPLRSLYEIVQSHAKLDSADQTAMSGQNRSPRWKRTVRNILQRKKSAGVVEWDHDGRYRFG